MNLNDAQLCVHPPYPSLNYIYDIMRYSLKLLQVSGAGGGKTTRNRREDHRLSSPNRESDSPAQACADDTLLLTFITQLNPHD